jgi:hypothetical protein
VIPQQIFTEFADVFDTLNEAEKHLTSEKQSMVMKRVWFVLVVGTLLFLLSWVLEDWGWIRVANLLVNIVAGLYGAGILFYFVERTYMEREQRLAQQLKLQALRKRLAETAIEKYTSGQKMMKLLRRSEKLLEVVTSKIYPNTHEILMVLKSLLEETYSLADSRTYEVKEQAEMLRQIKDILADLNLSTAKVQEAEELIKELELFNGDNNKVATLTDIQTLLNGVENALSLLKPST